MQLPNIMIYAIMYTMNKVYKKVSVALAISLVIGAFFSTCSFAEEAKKDAVYVKNVNPYYNYWKNEFIIFVDNYTGDKNNVSRNDLYSGKGTSRVYIFSKLKDGDYTYDDLINDMQNFDVTKNLHDLQPILVLLPKKAYNNESHEKLKNDDEKGKLVTGGPYSKYEKYKTGFYYKDVLQDKESINKILSDYKKVTKEIKDKLSLIKEYSIKDLYPNAHVAYLTTGATSVAGTPESKIYLVNLDKKFSPFNLSATDLYSKDVISGEHTKGILPEWFPETVYILNNNNQVIDQMGYETFQQYLWAKQDNTVIEWLNSLS